MKVISKLGIVLVVCAVIASLPASAGCGIANNRNFGSYSYYAGIQGGLPNAVGSFWQLGSFATANNGATPIQLWAGNCAGCTVGPDDSIYLAGSWGDATTLGCPTDPPALPKMAFMLSGPAAGGGAVFGAGCGTPDAGSGNYLFGAAGVLVPMQAIPKVNVTGSTRAPGQVTVNIGAPSVPGGLLDEGSCGLGVQSYRVYAQTVARNAPAPTDRARGTWGVAQGGVSPSSLTLPCVGNQDIYLAYSVVLNDGQESAHVGANSTVVQCGTTSAEQPTDFKLIQKKIRKPSSAQ